jgi:hypothetical protein
VPKRIANPSPVPRIPYSRKFPPNSIIAKSILSESLEGSAIPMIEEGHRVKISLGFNPWYEAIVPSVRATKTPTHPEIKNQPISPDNLIGIIVPLNVAAAAD